MREGGESDRWRPEDKSERDSSIARTDPLAGAKEGVIVGPFTPAVGALIAVQTLDGVANAIFSIVSILVVKDRTQGTGRFNVAAGSLATMVGIGAAASTTIGGVLIQHLGYRASFLGLAGIALVAFAITVVRGPGNPL